MARWLLCGLALLCSLSLAAPAAGADPIDGYVLNPNGDQRMGGVEVAFYVRQDDQVSEIMRKTTDAAGRFRFAGPFLTAGTPFALAAFYKDVTYFSSMLEVGAQKQVILEVYEPTSDDADIRIVSHNLFLRVKEGVVEVIHLVQFYNGGQHAYAGSGQGTERRVSAFRLPAGAFNIESHSGHINQADETTFFDNQPLLPGHSQLSFSFDLNTDLLDGGYWHEAAYPTERVELFVQPSTLEVGGVWADAGVMDLHGQQYRRLLMTDVAAGQRLLVPLPIDAPVRWILKWIALGGGALIGAGVLLVWKRIDRPVARTAPPALPDPDLPQHRQTLLEAIARLDRDHATDGDEETYRQTRRRLLEQAIDLTRRLEGPEHGR